MTEQFVHPTAEIHPSAVIGPGTSIWNWSKVRERARIGQNCRIGQGVYVDHDVEIGSGSKIQNGVSIYFGARLGERVFIGPHATLTNDLLPRASAEEWHVLPTVLEDDVSVGANATLVCGIRLGRGCMVGAGAVVIDDVPPFGLVVGNPARLIDFVDLGGKRLNRDPNVGESQNPELLG